MLETPRSHAAGVEVGREGKARQDGVSAVGAAVDATLFRSAMPWSSHWTPSVICACIALPTV